MKPSDFPKGPDGVRFSADVNSVYSFHVNQETPIWLAEVFDEQEAAMIASALNQVAEWEEKQDNVRNEPNEPT